MKILGIKINKRTLVRWKIYIDRARMYMGYINFVMITVVFLNGLENEYFRTFLDENKLISYSVMMISFFMLSLVLGRLDTKFGVRKEEMRNASSENPVLMEILEKVNSIEKQNQKDLPAAQ